MWIFTNVLNNLFVHYTHALQITTFHVFLFIGLSTADLISMQFPSDVLSYEQMFDSNSSLVAKVVYVVNGVFTANLGTFNNYRHLGNSGLARIVCSGLF